MVSFTRDNKHCDPNGLVRMILKTKYFTVGSTIKTAIDRPYMYEPLPIKPKSFL